MSPELAAVLAVPLGLAIGLAVGLLGGGGSIIAVPVLVYGFGQSVVAATTGSLVVVGLTAVAGSLGHHRAGRVRWADGLLFGLLGAGGAFLGTRASTAVPEQVLLGAFAVLLVVVAALMTRRRRAQARAGLGDADLVAADPERGGGRSGRRRLLIVVTATGVGLLTGFFGVGGGFAVVPALVLALGMAMPTAIGTSLVVIVVNTAVALGSRIAQPVHLDPVFLAVFGGAAVVGSLLGVRAAGRVSPARLSLGFTVLLLVIAAFTAVRSVTQLL